jgi:hypothetical protein
VDKSEARQVAQAQIAELRRQSWTELRDSYLDKPGSTEVTGASGAEYQLEIQAVWDGKPNGDLRVIVAVDDGGLSAFAPISESFIVAPDG